jgi:predicted GNAT superfamily acetyltransferase
VPASVQKLTQQLGGVVSGAFDRGDTLIGFVFGMTGLGGGAARALVAHAGGTRRNSRNQGSAGA